MVQEGVIRFELDFRAAAPCAESDISALQGWRQVMYRLQMIGQCEDRYDGLAYGNVSLRESDAGRSFLISGTQTGGLPRLGGEHFCRVLSCDTALNQVVAEGPVKPSSECLTHAALYAHDPRIGCVLHAHEPILWRAAQALGIAVTDARVEYGTPAMAAEVARILDRGSAPDGVITMGGHEDGVLAYGADPDTAGCALLRAYAAAVALPVGQS